MKFLEQYIMLNEKKYSMLIWTNVIFFIFYLHIMMEKFQVHFIYYPTVLISIILVSIIDKINKRSLLLKFSENKNISSEEIDSINQEYRKSYFKTLLILTLVIVARIVLSINQFFSDASQSQGFAIAALILLFSIANDCISYLVYILITIPQKNSKFMRKIQELKSND